MKKENYQFTISIFLAAFSFIIVFTTIQLIFEKIVFFYSKSVLHDNAIVFFIMHLISGFLGFIIIVPFLLKFYTKNLQSEISKKTFEINEKNQKLKERYHEVEIELKMAKTIQDNILPKQIIQYKNFNIFSRYIPMREIGGDYFDIIQFSEKKIGILITDVSGHGIHAALITAMLKIILSTASKSLLENPGKLFNYVNQLLINKIGNDFITGFYAVLDIENKKISFVNAGHPHPFKIDNNLITAILARGKPLGLFPESYYDTESIPLHDNCRMIFYTDGLTEAKNDSGDMFEKNKLLNVLNNKNNLPLKELINFLISELELHTGLNEFKDDIAIVGIDIQEQL